jgi:hypothetical protein
MSCHSKERGNLQGAFKEHLSQVRMERNSIITGNTDWNSRDLSPSVDTKRKFGGNPKIIRTLKTQISKLVEGLVE